MPGKEEFSSSDEAQKAPPTRYPQTQERLLTTSKPENAAEYSIISLDDVVPPQHLLRQNIDDAALRELAASIQQHGQLTPILVRPLANGKYELIAGLRRCMVLDALGETTVHAHIRTADDAESRHLTLVENLKRHDVNPVDEGTYFSILISENGMTIPHIAEQIGKSTSYIESRLHIARWPDYLREALLTSILNLTQCTEISRGQNPQVQRQLYTWTLDMGANARKIAEWRRELEKRVQTHIAAGGTQNDYRPPQQPVQPRFDCSACGAVTTTDHQRILSVCDKCFELIQQVIQQGYLRVEKPSPKPPQGG